MNRIVKKYCILLVSLAVLYSCSPEAGPKEKKEFPVKEGEIAGVQNQPVDKAQYTKILYVTKEGSDTTGAGTLEKPWKSIAHALNNSSQANKDNRLAIFVAAGTYTESQLKMYSWVDIYGGFGRDDGSRSILKNQTVIKPKDRNTLVIAANNSKIDGFMLSNGVVRGKGGVIRCDGTSPQISNNVFQQNQTLKPESWDPAFWHETAHDGGAIYCRNGASPVIRNNLFLENKTENGRGGAIAADHKCQVIISKNVFLNNRTGTHDPMRSSDGGAISIFRWSKAKIAGNIFLENKALTSNDGGAVFIALWSSAQVTDNLFVDNESGDDAGALFVGGQEHRYDAPLDTIPPADQFYVAIRDNSFFGNRNSSMNSGAMRFTMESRGEFINNVTAFNNGIYFQRSEVAIKNNIILDNFLFVETKKGLKKGSIENNYVWGEFNLQTPANVSGNVLRDSFEGGMDNQKGAPEFIDDGMSVRILSTNYSNQLQQTDILCDQVYTKNVLVNRVVRSKDQWGVVHSNEDNHVVVWGNFYLATEFKVLPTYVLANEK